MLNLAAYQQEDRRGNRQQRPDVVNLQQLLADIAVHLLLGQEPDHCNDRQGGERQVDVEYPAPV